MLNDDFERSIQTNEKLFSYLHACIIETYSGNQNPMTVNLKLNLFEIIDKLI